MEMLINYVWLFLDFEGFWNLFYFKYRICTGNDVNMFRIRFWDYLFIVVNLRYIVFWFLVYFL